MEIEFVLLDNYFYFSAETCTLLYHIAIFTIYSKQKTIKCNNDVAFHVVSNSVWLNELHAICIKDGRDDGANVKEGRED